MKCPFYVNEFASVQCSFDVSSSATYSRIRGNKSFRLDKKKNEQKKRKKKRKVRNEIYLTTVALHFLKL